MIKTVEKIRKKLAHRYRVDNEEDGWFDVNGTPVQFKDGVPVAGNAHLVSELKSGWAKDFPNVKINTTLSNIKKKYGELHKAAKSGDLNAGVKLVDSVCKEKMIEELSEKYKGATVVPVHSQENIKNILPLVYAQKFEKYGMEVDDQIVQSKKVSRTGTNAESRLLNKPEFDGKVEKGKTYLIVDDHITMGGTVKALKNYIESKGGTVVAVSSLTASKGSTQLAIKESTIEKVYDKFGKNFDKVLKESGIDESVKRLTEGEAQQILKYSVDGFRDRFIKKKQTRSADKNQENAV